MTRFLWESEEEWEEIPGKPRPVQPRPWRRWLLWGGLGLLLVSLTGIVLYWRVQEKNEELTGEILSSQDLLYSTLSSGDDELFLSLLSGRSTRWVRAEMGLFHQQQLPGFSPLGLRWAGQPPVDGDTLVELSPDLREATVRSIITVEDSSGRPIRRARTEVFRQGETRWLFSPPEEAFWGGWREFVEPARRVQATFPQRDAAAIWPIRAYLDEKIDQLCRLEGYDCPADGPIEIVFHHDPFVLVTWLDPMFTLESGAPIILPAPSLVGIPVDAEGTLALQRGYAALALSKIIVQLVNYECCTGQPTLVKALIDRQLAQLGVRPALLSPEDYQTFLNGALSPDPAALGERAVVSAESDRRAAILVEFWLDLLDQSEGSALREVAANRHHAWLEHLPPEELTERFRRFLQEQAAARTGIRPLQPAG